MLLSVMILLGEAIIYVFAKATRPQMLILLLIPFYSPIFPFLSYFQPSGVSGAYAMALYPNRKTASTSTGSGVHKILVEG